MIRQSIFTLFISLSISFGAAAQDAKLVEQAKKEGGKLIVYGSLESFTVEPIAEAFQKKTGIAVEYWRASATKVMDRALSETRAGKALFDVMLNNSGAMHVLKKEGLFTPYSSAATAAFPKESPIRNWAPSTAILRSASSTIPARLNPPTRPSPSRICSILSTRANSSCPTRRNTQLPCSGSPACIK